MERRCLKQARLVRALGGPTRAPSRRCAEPSQVAALVISTGMTQSWQQCDRFAIARKQQRQTIVREKKTRRGQGHPAAASVHARWRKFVISRDCRCLVLGLYEEEPALCGADGI